MKLKGFIVSNMPTGVIHCNTVDRIVCMSKCVVGASGIGSAVHVGQDVRFYVHYLMAVSPNSSPCHPCRAFLLRTSSCSDAFSPVYHQDGFANVKYHVTISKFSICAMPGLLLLVSVPVSWDEINIASVLLAQ